MWHPFFSSQSRRHRNRPSADFRPVTFPLPSPTRPMCSFEFDPRFPTMLRALFRACSKVSGPRLRLHKALLLRSLGEAQRLVANVKPPVIQKHACTQQGDRSPRIGPPLCIQSPPAGVQCRTHHSCLRRTAGDTPADAKQPLQPSSCPAGLCNTASRPANSRQPASCSNRCTGTAEHRHADGMRPVETPRIHRRPVDGAAKQGKFRPCQDQRRARTKQQGPRHHHTRSDHSGPNSLGQRVALLLQPRPKTARFCIINIRTADTELRIWQRLSAAAIPGQTAPTAVHKQSTANHDAKRFEQSCPRLPP